MFVVYNLQNQSTGVRADLTQAVDISSSSLRSKEYFVPCEPANINWLNSKVICTPGMNRSGEPELHFSFMSQCDELAVDSIGCKSARCIDKFESNRKQQPSSHGNEIMDAAKVSGVGDDDIVDGVNVPPSVSNPSMEYYNSLVVANSTSALDLSSSSQQQQQQQHQTSTVNVIAAILAPTPAQAPAPAPVISTSDDTPKVGLTSTTSSIPRNRVALTDYISKFSSDTFSNGFRKSVQMGCTLPGHIVSATMGSHEVVVSHDLRTYLVADYLAPQSNFRSDEIKFDWHSHSSGSLLSAMFQNLNSTVKETQHERDPRYQEQYQLSRVTEYVLVLKEPYLGPDVKSGCPRVVMKTNLMPQSQVGVELLVGSLNNVDSDRVYGTQYESQVTSSSSNLRRGSVDVTKSVQASRYARQYPPAVLGVPVSSSSLQTIDLNIEPLHRVTLQSFPTNIATHPEQPFVFIGCQDGELLLIHAWGNHDNQQLEDSDHDSDSSSDAFPEVNKDDQDSHNHSGHIENTDSRTFQSNTREQHSMQACQYVPKQGTFYTKNDLAEHWAGASQRKRKFEENQWIQNKSSS